MQSAGDHFAFVVSRHHHADRLCEILARLPAKTRRQPDDNQRAQDDQRRRHDHKSPEKFLERVINAKAGAADKARE